MCLIPPDRSLKTCRRILELHVGSDCGKRPERRRTTGYGAEAIDCPCHL
uniref:Uncharacterized protein n=1 Tax=Anguilla anguilla TaxID=7936 RepID=A0A0E9PXA2_ANGAN